MEKHHEFTILGFREAEFSGVELQFSYRFG